MIRVVFVSAALMGLAVAPAVAQDAAAGEQTFRVCRACHQIGSGAKNGVGPVLNGVVGRKAGTVEGYQYSAANKNSGLTWTPEELDKYLTAPAATVPHTKMINRLPNAVFCFGGLHGLKAAAQRSSRVNPAGRRTGPFTAL